MRDNKGFSLIELIVTLAILVIVSTGLVMGIGLLNGSEAKKCANKLDSGLSLTRTVCMSKASGQLELSCDASGDYYMEITGYAKEKIGKSSVSIVYTTGEGASAFDTALTSGTDLILSFKRGSGMFSSIGIDGSGQPLYCTKITATQNSKSKTIILIPETGKHYINN